jgi:hypothetical protein
VKKYILIIAFTISIVFHGIVLYELGMVDTRAWAHEAEYFQNSNPAQFNFLGAYGHPGGPIIEGVISLHNIFGITYDRAILLFMIIFDSLIISSSCLLCFLLSKNHFWWPVALTVLCLNNLYDSSTPPSTIASLLVVLLFLFTLFLYKKEEPTESSHLVLWIFISGLLISTRVDIGVVMTLLFAILLKRKTSLRKMFFVFLGIIAAFVIFNPFMWFMPVEHLGDLLYKITYHYNDFTPTVINLIDVLSFSSLTLVSIFILGIVIFIKKRNKMILPPFFFYILSATTVILYIVFLTARYKAFRYFLPITLAWEVLLPMSVFDLIEDYDLRKKRFMIILVINILITYYVGLFLYALWINNNYGLLP